ncbi:MAG TPA: MFS transporter [Solirubrobacterales bacterium]|nr:MFS transporter [Solirubrobacterales bacterium]
MRAIDRVLPLYLVVFIGFVGYSVMITVFTPLLLSDSGGLLPASSSIGERTVVSAGCYLLIALALHLRSLPLLMLGCLLAGLSEANIAIAQSAIADIAPVAQRSRLFGYVYLSSSLAYVVGPLVGGKLADSSIVSWFGYPTPTSAASGPPA